MAVARALVVEPEILLLDEPLSNLDANLREEMRFEIRRLHEAFGITTLYVTHDQAEAMVISDRIAVLERGRVAQVGTADEVFLQPRTRFVAEFIGRTNLVEGVAAGPDTVGVGALRLRRRRRRAGAGRARGRSRSARTISRWSRLGAAAAPGVNALRGTVQRASFLGDSVDYQVQLADSDVVLRVAAPAARRRRAGEAVSLSDRSRRLHRAGGGRGARMSTATTRARRHPRAGAGPGRGRPVLRHADGRVRRRGDQDRDARARRRPAAPRPGRGRLRRTGSPSTTATRS